MRICFVTSRFPYPTTKGDTVRVYHQLKALSRRHQLTLVSLTDAPLGPDDLAPVAELCERIHIAPHRKWGRLSNLVTGTFSRDPMQVRYFRSAGLRTVLASALGDGRFDAVHATLIRMAPYVSELTPRMLVVLDLVDSVSLNLLSRRNESHGPKRLAYGMEYRRVRAYEEMVVRQFPRLVISSPVDREVLGAPGAWVLPNGVDLDRFQFCGPDGRAPETIVFSGNMAYPPNVEAALWFAHRVWLRLVARRPGLRFEIVGATPAMSVRALAHEDARIVVRGRVDDMAAHLGTATVSVCPLQSGSGIQNKVLEAMACGTPVVSTTVGNQGVQAVPERDILIADDPEQFADAVERLLESPETRARMATYARAFVEERFRWEAHAAGLEALYSGAVEQPNRLQPKRSKQALQTSKWAALAMGRRPSNVAILRPRDGE